MGETRSKSERERERERQEKTKRYIPDEKVTIADLTKVIQEITKIVANSRSDPLSLERRMDQLFGLLRRVIEIVKLVCMRGREGHRETERERD